MTVVVAVSRAVWFANAEIVLACVVTGEVTGRTLHEIVLAAYWTVVCEGNVFINIEGPLRCTTVSAKRSHARSRRIVSHLPLWRRRHFVREIIQLPGRQFGQLTKRLDLSLERQLAYIHKPVAIVILSMNAQWPTNGVAERAWCKRILLREYFYPLISKP